MSQGLLGLLIAPAQNNLWQFHNIGFVAQANRTKLPIEIFTIGECTRKTIKIKTSISPRISSRSYIVSYKLPLGHSRPTTEKGRLNIVCLFSRCKPTQSVLFPHTCYACRCIPSQRSSFKFIDKTSRKVSTFSKTFWPLRRLHKRRITNTCFNSIQHPVSGWWYVFPGLVNLGWKIMYFTMPYFSCFICTED